MSKDNVSYITKYSIFDAQSKSASFNSNAFPVNNNQNIQLILNTISSSSLDCQVKIYGSIDGSTWVYLDSCNAFLTGDDDVLFTLSEIEALQFVRVSVTINTGSAIFSISARGV